MDIKYAEKRLSLSVRKPKNDQTYSYTYLYNKYYTRWQIYRFLGSLSASLAIIPAYLAYEETYSHSRTISRCEIHPEYVSEFKIATLILSYLGVFFEIIYKIVYYRWVRIYPYTFGELPPKRNLTLMEVIELTRNRTLYEFLAEKNTYLAILTFAIFPYPGLSIPITIPQQINYKSVQICYYVEEFLLFLMFIRIFYLVFTALSFGMLHTPNSRRILQYHSVPISATFSVKSYIRLYPFRILFFLFLIPGVCVFGLGLRIFERPFQNQDLDSLENCIWLTSITMFIVGYGDYFPQSIPGRTVACFIIFWGGVILSMTYAAVHSHAKFTDNEKSAYNEIEASKDSGIMILQFTELAKSKLDKKVKKISEKERMMMGKILEKYSKVDKEKKRFQSFSQVVTSLNHLLFFCNCSEYKLGKLKKSLKRLEVDKANLIKVE